MKRIFESEEFCGNCRKKTKQTITIDGNHIIQECQVKNCDWRTEAWGAITITKKELEKKLAQKVGLPWIPNMNPSKRYEIHLDQEFTVWIPFSEELNKIMAGMKEKIKKISTKQIKEDLKNLRKWKVHPWSKEEIQKTSFIRVAQDELKRRTSLGN